MPLNVCIFVDGENFRHSIGGVFDREFKSHDYLPPRAEWDGFFDWLVAEAFGADAGRLRAYWYVLQDADFYPYRLPSAETDSDSLRVTLSKFSSYRERLRRFEGDALVTEMRQMSDTLNERRNTFQRRFSGWQVIQDGIAKSCRAIEFRRAGAIRYDLFTRKLGQEKAVDVKLATDLIGLRSIYDCAILVSGDQDYVPAVQYVKDAGKTVVNVGFKTRDGRLLPGGARRLNVITDQALEVPFDDFARHLNIEVA